MSKPIKRGFSGIQKLSRKNHFSIKQPRRDIRKENKRNQSSEVKSNQFLRENFHDGNLNSFA
jgi:hypothetical protein